MRSETDEFSFILKPSKYGIGVFATHDIKKGTFLRTFGDAKKFEERVTKRKREDIPEEFRGYCHFGEEYYLCPLDFGSMHIGWYLNHSAEDANTESRDTFWYAKRDIKKGEEILIDYNLLGEPEELKEEFYK